MSFRVTAVWPVGHGGVVVLDGPGPGPGLSEG
jgi:hypothetical protein